MSEYGAIQVVGLLGYATISLSLLPQVFKTFRTRSAADISYVYQTIYIIGCTLSNIYALHEGLWPIYIPGIFEEFMIILLTAMKIYFEQVGVNKVPKEAETIETMVNDAIETMNEDTNHP